jgi:hypothetical protein
MKKQISPEFLDVINYAICRAGDDFLQAKAVHFFRKVGEHHLNEALERKLIKVEADDKPLDVLIKIAKYLESMGYMKKIFINKLSETEAIVEMHGVTVTKSSVKLIKEGKHPSHYMTNIMHAALRKLGIEAELEDLEFNEEECRFKEHWKILEK